MKKLTYALLLLPVIISCNSNSNNAKKNISLIEKYVRSVEDLDYLTMESILDDNYFGYGPSYGDSIGKAQAVEYWKENVKNLYESIKYNKSRNVAVTITTGENQGDWVSNWGELHIVYQNGKGEVTLWANTTYQIENGKIVKSYTFYNEADALSQLGYVFINPNDL